jgi:formylglycine-generating enzyme required for sulfatase activity
VETFHIGKYEVTWGEWKTVRAWATANGYSDLANIGVGTVDGQPVQQVNWFDVVKWCNAKSEMEGLVPVYHVTGDVILPNQPRNIYRNGSWNTQPGVIPLTGVGILSTANGYRLPIEKEWEWAARGGVLSKGYSHSGGNDGNSVAWTLENSSGAPKVVGTKPANELGIYDMSGNMWEWCADFVDFSNRRIRGGSWANGPSICTVSVREQFNPSSRNNGGSAIFGFRLARNAQ